MTIETIIEENLETSVENLSLSFEEACEKVAKCTKFEQSDIKDAYAHWPERLTELYNEHNNSGVLHGAAAVASLVGLMVTFGAAVGALGANSTLDFAKCAAVVTASVYGFGKYISHTNKKRGAVVDEVREQINHHKRQQHYGNTPN